MKNKINVTSLIIISVIFLLPYFIMIVSCFSTNAAIKGNMIFSNLSFDNLKYNITLLFNEKIFLSSMINSSIISTISAALSVTISSLAGYAYNIYKNKYMERFFVFSFISIMIPCVVNIIPLFLIINYLKIIDTYFAVIICSISLPFNIYLFKQNTRLMPIEIIKAARIDGLTEFKIFYKVYLPCMKAVFITSFILSFLEAWNSLLIPVIVIQSQNKFTNSLYLNSLGSFWTSDYALLMLSLVLSTLPIIILFIIFQKYVKNGIRGIN